MLLLELRFEQRSEVGPQRFDWQQKLRTGGDPLPAVRAETAAGNEVMNVRMKDERARPGMEHAQEAQVRSQPARIAGQFLQGPGT